MLKDLLVGNNKRRLVSATVLLIIAFLIHVKNKKTDNDVIRGEREKKEVGESKKKRVGFYNNVGRKRKCRCHILL